MEGSGKVAPTHQPKDDDQANDTAASSDPRTLASKETGNEQKQHDAMTNFIMGASGIQGMFPFPGMMGGNMASFEGKADNDMSASAGGPKMPPFGGWLMEGMMSMNMMQSPDNSIDGSLMPPLPYASGVEGMKTADGSSMPMMYFPPMMMEGMQPDFGKDGNMKLMPHQNLMMPMISFMDEKTALQNLKRVMPQMKAPVQKKYSEADNMKAIPTSVQIRETCQLKSWRRKIQKARSQLKVDQESTSTSVNQMSQKPADFGEKDGSNQVQEAYDGSLKDDIRRNHGNIELRWQDNRYGAEGELTEAEVKELTLFYDIAMDKDIGTLKAALDRIDEMPDSCHPYVFLEDFSAFEEVPKNHLGLWVDDNAVQKDGSMDIQSDIPALTRETESTLKAPIDTPLDLDEWEAELEKPAPVEAVEAHNLVDELEDELLEGISDDSKDSDFEDKDRELYDELDFDMDDEGKVPAPAPAPHTLPPKNRGERDSANVEDGDLFGEVNGTLSHYMAKMNSLKNEGDVVNEWRGFRSRIKGPLSLTNLVEFEHLWKVFQDKRLYDLAQLTTRQADMNVEDDYAPGNMLYRVGEANLRLLLELNRPNMQELMRSSIYNLNSPMIMCTIPPPDDDAVTNDNVGQAVDTPDNTPKQEVLEITKEIQMENATDESLLQGKESDIRRNWRRRLQTLAKETRLALVNMGKSLRDIENVSTNAEQTRAYDAVVEFCKVAEEFRQKDYLHMLNQSFDDYYEQSDPHDSGNDGKGSNRRELLHTRVAKNLTGILPLVGKAAKYHNVRFHKPDFRSGLFLEHLRVLRGNYSSEWTSWSVHPLLGSTVASSFTEESGANDDMKSHPSNYFIHSTDLSLNDDCKIALMEYVEQTPLLLPNCGMASRIDNYVNCGEEENKDIASLGPLGTLCPTTDGIDLFGIKHTIDEGEGQAILESTLYKAPIFVHPRPGSPCQDKLNLTTTDFLLTRSRSDEEVVLRLRPLTWQNGVAVYTVGQCEPKVDIHAPTSKNFVEDCKDLLKAWVLKSVMVGSIIDMKHLRKEARKKFCPVLTDKDISQMLKQMESTPIFSLRAQALERMIHTTIKPEIVCSLESSRSGKARLATMGILHLKNPDNIGGVFIKVQDEERQYQQRLQSMNKRLRELKSSYVKRLEAHGISGEKLENEIKQFDFGLQVSIYGHLEDKSIAPKIRFIKDVLNLTPWNLSRDVKQVLNNRGTAQFALHGFGDPSGGRGEGINLLKRQVRESSVDNSYVGEDLRKLSMQELAKRLRCYGVADAVIKTLPRWDQVALVRQYRDGFGGQSFADGDNRWRIPPEEYQKKLNDILLKQREALLPDDPDISDSEDVKDGDMHDDNADGIANALLEAFDEVSDKDDDLDLRELEILRQLRETQNSGPMSEEERMADVNKLKAVPGIMWLRQSRRTSNEPFGHERAVFVYGEENLRKLLKWRMQRVAVKKSNLQNEHCNPSNIGSRRICRACGQAGHISSNPKCPLYKGEKIKAADHAPQLRSQLSQAMNTRKHHRYEDSSEGEITASTAALECDTADWLLRDQEARYKRRLTYQASFDDSDDGLDSIDEGSIVNARRKRSGIDIGNLPGQNLSSHMEQLMKLVSKALRMVEKEARFKPFTSRIPESIAPNYYKIIMNPMWISLLKSKCKTRCYNDLVHFFDDLALIELNCKQFNSETSPNAWLRKMSEVLVDEVLMRIQQLTSHLIAPNVIEDWAKEHRANRIRSVPLPPVPAGVGSTPQVEII
ncbi:bromodomain containing protein [Babesia divergens]|uniref:Bromodomain containing protein n=1 Tax=Babesia divergens TaxID=32595 RepID=A0AAD9GA90_BABDI|nr:bromodomain containing protein [Babesia divergens]